MAIILILLPRILKVFGQPFVKRFVLCYQTVVCLSCLSVCLSVTLVYCGQTGGCYDETWQAGRPRPWPHCVRWGPISRSAKGAHPQFLAHVSCGQMAGWIKMPLGMEVGLSPGDFVFDGEPALPEKKAQPPAPSIRFMSVVTKRLNGWRCHSVQKWTSAQATLC